MKSILIILLIVFSLGVPVVYGHPFTEETHPSSSSNAAVGITEVYVIYSEPVEIDFSELRVLDSNGNQIDNRDTKYYNKESALIVTTPPLEEGVYTVTSKVLSKVDGHLVNDAFIFAVGDIELDPGQLEKESKSESLFLPEAAARFPGLVGQTIVLGSIIAALLIWGTQNKKILSGSLPKIQVNHNAKFLSITGIGLVLVFISNIVMLAVQSFRLETSALEAIQTTFGMTWLIRMIITIVLLGIWFWIERAKEIKVVNQIPMLVVSLILIGTTTMMGHGAASEQIEAVILDYVHNLVAAVWIGGIIYFVFVLLPVLGNLEDEVKEKISLVMIPRFSIAFVIAVGIVVITGPTLLWLLENNVSLITESTYGKLIFAKIAIAAIMVGLGGYFQFRIQRPAELKLKNGNISVHKKLKRSLKLDAALGILLLGVVALLANGSLPAGEIQKAEADEIQYGFSTVEFTQDMQFDVEITPFTSGSNEIIINPSDLQNNAINDLEQVKVKVSNPSRNITPIEVPLERINLEDEPDEFRGELTFGFSGNWLVEIEAQRTENANESIRLDLLVKPHLEDLKVEIVEYEFPVDSKPLYPLYDGHESIWISDPSAPKLWRFDLAKKEFDSFTHSGTISMFLTIDSKGKIWFTDTPTRQIGFFDPEIQEFKTISLPKIQPLVADTIATFIQADFDDNIWIAVTNKDVLLKYNQKSESFEEFRLPDRESLPFALASDNEGKIWFTESGKGRIGYINPENNEIKEFEPETPLEAPEFLLFDNSGNLWIAEHTGVAISKFNIILETFEQIPVIDQEALPYGMSFDRYENIWIAQHTVDSFAAYDPHNNNLIEVPIPTETSFVQFTTTDSDDNVWFVEQRGNKLGMIKITELPSSQFSIQTDKELDLKYTEIASPLMALGIIATSLFFVKNVKDKRRLNALVSE